MLGKREKEEGWIVGGEGMEEREEGMDGGRREEVGIEGDGVGKKG